MITYVSACGVHTGTGIEADIGDGFGDPYDILGNHSSADIGDCYENSSLATSSCLVQVECIPNALFERVPTEKCATVGTEKCPENYTDVLVNYVDAVELVDQKLTRLTTFRYLVMQMPTTELFFAGFLTIVGFGMSEYFCLISHGQYSCVPTIFATIFTTSYLMVSYTGLCLFDTSTGSCMCMFVAQIPRIDSIDNQAKQGFSQVSVLSIVITGLKDQECAGVSLNTVIGDRVDPHNCLFDQNQQPDLGLIVGPESNATQFTHVAPNIGTANEVEINPDVGGFQFYANVNDLEVGPVGSSYLHCHDDIYARQFSTRNGGQSYQMELESYGKENGIDILLRILATTFENYTVRQHGFTALDIVQFYGLFGQTLRWVSDSTCQLPTVEISLDDICSPGGVNTFRLYRHDRHIYSYNFDFNPAISVGGMHYGDYIQFNISDKNTTHDGASIDKD